MTTETTTLFGCVVSFGSGVLFGSFFTAWVLGLFKPPELPSRNYPTMQDVFLEMARRDEEEQCRQANERFKQQRERVEQRLAEARERMTT